MICNGYAFVIFFCQFLGVVSEAGGTLGVPSQGLDTAKGTKMVTIGEVPPYNNCYIFTRDAFTIPCCKLEEPYLQLRSINSQHCFMQVTTHIFLFWLMCWLQAALWEGLELHDVVTS